MRPFRYPHPLTSGRLVLAFHPGTLFGGTCFDYQFNSNKMSEAAKKDARTIWFIRIGCFTLSYGRML